LRNGTGKIIMTKTSYYGMAKRNVALLILDCVRKDFFEEYAPRLLRMSNLSVERCYAASSWSTPSHASIFTGKLPHRHGVHAHNLDFRQLEADTFLERLTDHTTVATSTNLFAGPSFGFDTLFDEFWNASRNGLFMGGMNIEEFNQETSSDGVGKYGEFLKEAYYRGCLTRSLMNGVSVKMNDVIESSSLPRLYDYGANSMIRGSLSRLPDKEPFFYFANFMEAHSPYSPSVKYDTSLYDVPRNWSENAKEWEINKNPDEYSEVLQGRRDVYGASIDYLDKKVSSFIERILDRTDEETVVFITADHGENLALEQEEFIWGHQGSLSHPLLHVPFVAVNFPDKYAGSLERERLSHLDLGEVITSVANDEPLDIPTRDLIPAERVGYGPSTEPEDFKYWDRAIRCVYDGRSRYEWDSLGNSFEYEVEGDSAERKAEQNAEIPDEATGLFDEEIEEYKMKVSGEDRMKVDERTQNKLSDLGYL
jgi:hypothetical protein